jgi:stage V sporulation protein B
LRSTQAAGAALAAAMVVGAVLVRMTAGVFVPPATAVRAALALAACVALGLVTPRFGRLVTPLAAVAVAAAYAAILVVTREVGRADLAMIRGLAGKRKS